jgi:hypothetical protein
LEKELFCDLADSWAVLALTEQSLRCIIIPNAATALLHIQAL